MRSRPCVAGTEVTKSIQGDNCGVEKGVSFVECREVLVQVRSAAYRSTMVSKLARS